MRREGFEDRYQIVDARTHHIVNVERLPHAAAQERMKWLELSPIDETAPTCPWLGGWRG